MLKTVLAIVSLINETQCATNTSRDAVSQDLVNPINNPLDQDSELNETDENNVDPSSIADASTDAASGSKTEVGITAELPRYEHAKPALEYQEDVNHFFLVYDGGFDPDAGTKNWKSKVPPHGYVNNQEKEKTNEADNECVKEKIEEKTDESDNECVEKDIKEKTVVPENEFAEKEIEGKMDEPDNEFAKKEIEEKTDEFN